MRLFACMSKFKFKCKTRLYLFITLAVRYIGESIRESIEKHEKLNEDVIIKSNIFP